MSQYVGNHDACATCGMLYKGLRTGLTYRDVYEMVKSRRFKRRGTVLGKWHEIKQEHWKHHQAECAAQDAWEKDVPF